MGGNGFTKSGLQRLLTNVIYAGKIGHHDRVYPGEHEGIVDPRIWEEANMLLGKNSHLGGHHLRNKYGALLRGILFCDACGTAMRHTYTMRRGRRYRYYVCVIAQERGWAACPTKSVNAQEIEDAVVERIRGIGENGEVVQEAMRSIRQKTDTRMSELREEKKANERVLGKLNAKIDKMIVRVSLGGDEQTEALDRLADLQDKVRRVEQKIRETRDEIRRIEGENLDAAEVERMMREFSPIWESLSPPEQMRLIRQMVQKVGLRGDTGDLTVVFRSEGIRDLCGARK
jgi:site-specific DNA recombinase